MFCKLNVNNSISVIVIFILYLLTIYYLVICSTKKIINNLMTLFLSLMISYQSYFVVPQIKVRDLFTIHILCYYIYLLISNRTVLLFNNLFYFSGVFPVI